MLLPFVWVHVFGFVVRKLRFPHFSLWLNKNELFLYAVSLYSIFITHTLPDFLRARIQCTHKRTHTHTYKHNIVENIAGHRNHTNSNCSFIGLLIRFIMHAFYYFSSICKHAIALPLFSCLLICFFLSVFHSFILSFSFA